MFGNPQLLAALHDMLSANIAISQSLPQAGIRGALETKAISFQMNLSIANHEADLQALFFV